MIRTTVTFPALCVPRDSGVYLVRDLSELERSRAQLFWRYRHFDGLRLYDSDERAFEVTAARVVKPTWRLGHLFARVFDLTISVDLEISVLSSASLSEVTAAVHRAIEADPESFEELSTHSVAWWRATLAHADSVQGVIRAFDSQQT